MSVLVVLYAREADPRSCNPTKLIHTCKTVDTYVRTEILSPWVAKRRAVITRLTAAPQVTTTTEDSSLMYFRLVLPRQNVLTF